VDDDGDPVELTIADRFIATERPNMFKLSTLPLPLLLLMAREVSWVRLVSRPQK
jgi:hypothetical protein